MNNSTFTPSQFSLRARQSLLTSAATAALALSSLLATPTPARAQTGIPAAINYQGKLTDSLGHPVTNGFYQVWFRVWDNPTQSGAGDYIWGRSFPLNVVSNGMFNVLLTDSGAPINVPGTPSASSLLSAFEGPNRYLGLSVAANPQGTIASPVEISPRQQLVAAPFAIHTYNASVAVNAGFATNAYQALYATSAGATPFYATNGLQTAGQSTLNGTLNVQSSTTTGGGFVPIGGIIMWNGGTVPAGWALCDGTLQNGIQTPDLRGRFVLGSSASHAAGTSGGSELHTNTIAEMAPHNHTLTVGTVGYSATWANNSSAPAAPNPYQGKNNGNETYTANSTGAGAGYSIMPPYYVLAYIIRVR